MNFKLPSLRAIGPYLLVLLITIRFLIMPLNSAAKQKKLLLAERQELYATEQSLLQRRLNQEAVRSPKWDDETLARLFYPKDALDPVIQAELVKRVIEAAEKKGLTVLNFEFPDVARDKEVSEIGVILRFKGQPRGLVDLLKEIEDFPKPVSIKSVESSKSGADFTIVLSIAAFRIEG